MKLILVFLFSGMISLQASVSLGQKVSLRLESVSLQEMLNQIREQTGYRFLLIGEESNQVTDLSVDVKDMPLDELLEMCLEKTSVTFHIVDNTILISKRQEQQKAGIPQTETREIRGKVMAKDKQPLAGSTVFIKGTTLGTATDANGEFKLSVPADTRILVASFIGYENREVALDDRTYYEIVLEEEASEIGEVVVTGLFTKAKESYTGAVTTITAEELRKVGNRNLLTSIRNIDPGFNIVENNQFGSDPNRLPDITIRGNSSMDMTVQDLQSDSRNTANQPLFIMDGFEISLSRMMDLDQNIVENITLLKDASATAMYGTRGANGVVVITTRKPEAGKLRITYTGNINIEAPDLRSYNLMNSLEKLAYEKAAGLYSTVSAEQEQVLLQQYNNRLGEALRGVDTYWLKYPVRTGVGNRNSLRVEGGSEEFRYAVNLSYDHIAGAMKGSKRNTFNGDINLSYQMNNVIFQNNLLVSFNRSQNSPYGTFSDFSKINAYFKPYDDNGNLIPVLEDQGYYVSLGGAYNTVHNPLYNALLPSLDESKYTQIQNNFSIEWKIFPELTFRGRFSYSRGHSRSDQYTSALHTKFNNYAGDDFSRKGEYIYGTGESNGYEVSLSLNYNKTFNEKHQLFAGGDFSMAEEKTEDYIIKAEGISNIHMDFLGMATLYEKGGRPQGSEGISRRMGGTVNVNYTYDRRYFVDISGKMEGSSKFGANDRTAPFWSLGAGWNLHNEPFMKQQSLFSSARVRISYGTSGSQNFDPYQALRSYKDFGNQSYNGWYGVYMMGLGNPGLGWQTTYQTNLGFDVEILNGRFRLTADFYNKQTDDMLADITLPTASGFNSYKANIGKVNNRGLEISANAYIVRNTQSGWIWSAGGSLAHNKNEIKKISNSLEFLNETMLERDKINPSFLFKEGQSMNTIFAVKSMGIDPSNGKEIFLKQDGSLTNTWDAKDKIACGVTDPKIWGNLNTVVSYKNLTFTAIFSYRHGGKQYNSTLVSKVENILPYDNADRRAYYDRWKAPGEHALYKSVRDFSETKASTRFVMDESTLQCNNLSLQYELQSEWLKKNLSLSYLSITGYMEDVFRLSTIKQERGLSYPFSRKFSIALSARF